MRRIERTSQFKRDYKRERKGKHGAVLDGMLLQFIDCLIEDTRLPARANDHALSGEWEDFRDCHIKPDLVLIYRKPNDNILQLVRLGSHSELGL
ncbi:MAG: type II toxin-antitoxin system YafQ family toxin [Candidatus Eremiobacteraeota bacterium]|nr:type II toxin-antitoxin system YafQ family toxin [Candidatus Eremiobacteraeota bacterium]